MVTLANATASVRRRSPSAHTRQLLARNRPECITIVGNVVARHLACEPNTYWSTLRSVLQNRTRQLWIAGLAAHMPELRIPDTLPWMRWN